MFVGHTALALAAKRAAPTASLGTLVAATFALDLVWPVLLLAGVEHVRVDPGNTAFTPFDFEHYPWSHSLLMAIVWGAVAAAVYRRRGSAHAATVVGAVVVSHWVLDALVHRPDLPLWPGASPFVGLGLWRSIPATFVVEGVLLAIGLASYLRQSTPSDAIGRWALVALIALQTVIWLSGPYATPPPGERPVAFVGLALALFIPWAAWIDRHRRRVQ